MPKPTATERALQRRSAGLTCAVRGCWLPVTGLSRYCDDHDRRNQATGHPEGRTIRKADLRPFVKLTAAFIDQHRSHPGISAALDWITARIADAKDPRYLSRKSSPEQRVAKWLAKMRREGVDPKDVLAAVAAVYLLREYRPSAFKSDRHFDHQVAIRVLRLVPAPFVDRWTGTKVRRSYDWITVGTREHLSHRLKTALGLLSLRMAREILPTLTKPDPDHLQGADAPFTTTN